MNKVIFGLNGIYYDYTSLSCAPDGGWTGWEFLIDNGDELKLYLTRLTYQKK